MENILNEILNSDLKKCVISSPRRKSMECRKCIVRPIIIKGELLFQFEYHYEKKVTHENMIPFDTVSTIMDLVADDFKQVDIFTSDEEIQILASKPERPRIRRKTIQSGKNASGSNNDIKKGLSRLSSISSENILSHDRQKNHIIKEGVPCDFLIRLGVMNDEGRVIKKHYSKFRQINRFLEIVDDAADALIQSRPLKIIDFGCGKAYLTFALYYYFHNIREQDVIITGLDLKEDVIEFCNGVARDLSYNGLTFLHGDIADYKDDGCDMVVTLHACDTATDYALINAVSWNAPVILSVPCCQHELFRQIKNEDMRPMLKYGLLKDRFTELLTDSLRALALEAKGYQVQIIEFTTLEHTMKNIMIRAVRKTSINSTNNAVSQVKKSNTNVPAGKKAKRALDEYSALKKQYNVHPAIDAMFTENQPL